MTKQNFIIPFLLLLTIAVSATGNKAANRISVKDYIKKWAPVAQKHMREYRIPASIILAQGILESGYGNSSMAQNANNHFGIKCLGWKGDGYYQRNAEKQCYRKYNNTEECFRDHARILTSKSRYSFLFRYRITDYRSWAKGLKKAGYAMDPEYDRLLIRTIEEYKLHSIDQMVSGVKETYKPTEKAREIPVVKIPLRPQPTINLDSLFGDNSKTLEAPVKDMIILPLPEDNPESNEWRPITALRHIFIDEDILLSELARDLNISLKNLLAFNDLHEDRVINAGERIYLEEKLRICDYDVHTLRSGQTLWQVAQLYGLKMGHLAHLNGFKADKSIASGTVVRLK